MRTHWKRSLLALAAALVAAAVTAGFALARPAAKRAASPTAGVVVIDTTLGYEGSQAAGTGMVLTSSGEVLTNNHVIEGATKITVRVPQTGRSYAATVLGYSVSADTALLQLKDASGLTTVATGSSSSLKRGQAVRAVGNAGGTGRLTLVRGAITGLGKAITASDGQGQSERLTGLVETNANVRPGDSGGPLLDASGRVVGMDTAASATGGFTFQQAAADAYAIPIAKALAVAKQVEAHHASATVHIGGTAFLGIQVSSPGRGYGYGYGYGYGSDTPAGALVAGVVSGSPADLAGLAYGDEITGIDGKAVSSADGLVGLLLQHHPGDKVTLRVLDPYGGSATVTVRLASGPAQ